MYIIFFLSVITLFLAGISLSSGLLSQKMAWFERFSDLVESDAYTIIVGLLTFASGIAKLFSVTAGNVPVVGDLLPALGGLFLGAALIFQFYKARSTESPDESGDVKANILDVLFIQYKDVFGILGVIIALVHLIFHWIILL